MFPIGPLVAPLIMGGAQLITGIAQRGAANRRRKKAMSEMKYDIPSATKEQLQLARERASQTGLPGEDITRGRMESGIAEGVSKGESVAETSSDVLGMYQKMYGNKMDMNRQILEKGAEYKSNNELQLMQSMGLMAEAENQQFYYNKFAPFLSEMGYAGEQAAGGSANIAGGLQTGYAAFMNKFMADEYNKGKNTGDGGISDTNRLKLNNIANYGKSQAPAWQTDLEGGYSTPGLSPWTNPRDEYNIGHPDREQMYRPNN